MNPTGLLILLLPALGLIPIVQKRSWRVTSHWTGNFFFWLGWFGSLIVGLIVLFS